MILKKKGDLKDLIVVGDRVLIRPKKATEKTETGLYLPQGVQEKEKIQSGYVVKVGPGYPLPFLESEEDSWKPNSEPIKYIPLQAKEGDLAIYLQKNAYEVIYEGEKFHIISQSSILLLERDPDFLS
ncbi:MAG: co-chaperone GroES family protein [Cytophagales bacterium]